MDDVERTLGRRALVRGLGGFAVTVAGIGVAVPALATAAGAQPPPPTAVGGAGATSGTTAAGVPPTGSPTSAPPATPTTTVPPSRPPPTALAFLALAQSFELVLVQAYDTALSTNLLSPKVASTARSFQDHHRDQAQSFAGIAGKAAPGSANQSLLAAGAPSLQSAGSEAQLVQALLQAETASLAT